MMSKPLRAIMKAKVLSISGLLIIIYGMAVAQRETGLKKNEQQGKVSSDSLVIVAFGNSVTATRKTVKAVFAQRLPTILAGKNVLAKVINSGIPGSHTGRLSDNSI